MRCSTKATRVEFIDSKHYQYNFVDLKETAMPTTCDQILNAGVESCLDISTAIECVTIAFFPDGTGQDICYTRQYGGAFDNNTCC